MQKKTSLIITAFALAAGCGKKTPITADSSVAQPGPTAGGAAAPTPGGTATPPPPRTADQGDVGTLKEVVDCPKSLAGTEELARTLKKECGPIRVTGNYDVEGTLTLEAGVVLKFDEGAELNVGYGKAAKIITKGTEQDPVVLTSSGDQVAGFWKGLHIYAKGNRSRLEGLVIDFAGGDRGAVYIEATDVMVKGSTIRNAKEIGLKIEDRGSVSELDGNRFEKAGAIALSVPVAALGGLGTNNTFDADSVIEVRAGTVDKSARWQPAGAPYLFTGDTNIDGKNVRAVVDIAPGTELRFAEGAVLAVGYNSAAGLNAVGSADQPVLFTSGGEKTVGAWPGVHVYGNGEAKFENVVIEFGGKQDERGAIHAEGESSLSVKATTFKGNRSGVTMADSVKLKALDGNRFSGSEKRSLQLAPQQLGAVGAGNSFGENERIEVRGGEVKETTTWLAQPTTIEILDDLSVDRRAVLTLAPGLELRFRDGVSLSVAYNEEASLKASGSAEKPIKLRGVREEAGSWDGIELYPKAKDVVLEHVELSYAGGDAGVRVKALAVAKLANVTCVKCSAATLTWECDAKVTATDVKAGEGTAKAEVKPEGCP